MPECHKCKHDGKGHAACLRCRGPSESNHHGRCFVSVDSAPAGLTEADRLPTDPPAEPARPLETLVRYMIELPARRRDVLLSRLAWPASSQSELGRALSIPARTLRRELKAAADSLPGDSGAGLRRLLGYRAPPGKA